MQDGRVQQEPEPHGAGRRRRQPPASRRAALLSDQRLELAAAPVPAAGLAALRLLRRHRLRRVRPSAPRSLDPRGLHRILPPDVFNTLLYFILIRFIALFNRGISLPADPGDL